MVGERAIELERLLARRRKLSAVLLDYDGYERWGQGSDPAFERHAHEARAERERISAELEARVMQLREAEPDAVVEWAEAHLRLIDASIADAGPDLAVNAHVAVQERIAWEAVAAGTRAYVAENTYYRSFDPRNYRREFGFEP